MNPMHDTLLQGFFQQVREASTPSDDFNDDSYEEDREDFEEMIEQGEENYLNSFSE